MIDYLIVGSGLAGIAFAEMALQNHKSIAVFENHSQNSSSIAGGLYNPVILKRFSEVWKSQEQIDLVNHFYADLEVKLKNKFDYKIPIFRKLYSVEEQNNWFVASDKPNLAPFLATKIWGGLPAQDIWGTLSTTQMVAFEFSLYPNPTNDRRINIDSEMEVDEIQLININGQLMQQIQKPTRTNNTYTVENLPSGFYFIKISSENQSITKKVIVN